ncbi:MAG: SMC family ATPase [Acidobacteria bacterium]|nr:SMC family ATPase [Acidobacteriota bacterium]
MRITRLYLRNYRVFADELDLPIPAGLVGIYGPNGAGKSALVGSIRWTLFGKDRTGKDDVRTTGVGTECITEVEFEHESHLYLVRRQLAGANNTQKAEVHWNGSQVAEGVTDVRRYVESVLGMDDASFRASVFAEQNQVSAFSDVSPDKRRELVLRLLGITPLDKARDLARADARTSKQLHDQLQVRLPDLDDLRDDLAAKEQAATEAERLSAVASAAALDAVAAHDAAIADHDALDRLRQGYDGLVQEGKAVVALLQEATEQLDRLTAEQAELAGAATTLDALNPIAAGVPTLERRLAAVQAVDAARLALAALPAPTELAVPDATEADLARVAADEAAAAAADLAGEVRAARGELARAEESASRSASLSTDEDCPMCGQALGDAFAHVQDHRRQEVEAAAARLADLVKRHQAATKRHTTATKAADQAQSVLRTAQQAWAAAQEHAVRRGTAEAALAAALDGLEAAPAENEAAHLSIELAAARQAAAEVQRLEGKLERAGTVAVDLASASARVDELTDGAEALRVRVRELGFDAAALAAARQRRDEARSQSERQAGEAEAARLALVTAGAAAATAKVLLSQAEERHAELKELVDDVRHTSRVAELLAQFRNTVVQAVGPQLASQAAELFAELTDHEYERLDVNPETYEIRISDAGIEHGLARFSGSETDLANLALRVAISEQVRFQSGGAVGLLVLDEVFGPLDDDRKARMLLALERLKGRFRQVLVVTHDSEIKEQLPSAIQVVKLPGRRATATVLSGV